jgi:hypothetical protein
MLNHSYWRLHPSYSKSLVLNCEEDWNELKNERNHIEERKKDEKGIKKEGKEKSYKICCQPWIDAILTSEIKI